LGYFFQCLKLPLANQNNGSALSDAGAFPATPGAQRDRHLKNIPKPSTPGLPVQISLLNTVAFEEGTFMPALLETQVLPLIGESAWHSLIVDPRIAAESERHFQEVTQIISQYGAGAQGPLHILEIACYAHTTGYTLAQRLGAKVTLFELSQHSLRLGKKLGESSGTGEANPRLVMGDFHRLPFADNSFNVVYICSALHHTWNYPQVMREMMRVLAPQGLLFLENEPTLRSLCFYKFRCNRLHELTPLETKLQQLGLLTTLAEPYLGSRPESLFGMVENQSMPLPTLLEITEEACDILSVYLSTAFCMGAWEKNLAQRRLEPAWKLAADLEETLLAGVREAAPLLTLQEAGAGRSLPNETEIRALAQRVGRELHALPENEEGDFILKLAEIFGAPLQLVARKKSPATKGPAADLQACAETFNRACACENGVFIGFPGEVRGLLTQASLVPDVQTGSEQALHGMFPASDWHFVNGEFPLIAMDGLQHDLRSILNLSARACIQLPAEALAGPTLLVLRVFCAQANQHFYRLEISAGGEVVSRHDVYQPESVLLRAQLSPALLQASQGRVQVQLTALRPGDADSSSIAVSHIGLYRLAL
jgi:ubiquinone/menaquinone biosynthesis C-methylase UbiE